MSENPSEGHARSGARAPHERESLLERLLTEAVERIELGERVDIGALCHEHPELEASVAAALGLAPELRRIHREGSRRDVEIGTLLGGRYRLEQRIGVGAMGVVFEAHDVQLGRAVAVKLLRAELVAGARMDARLAREGEVLASIRHPNVVTVFDRGRAADGRAFLVMELLRGCNASHLLRCADDASGARASARERAARFRHVVGADVPLADNDVRQVVTWIASAAGGLHAAHQAGVVHRDVKPSNLFVESDGRIVVLDFGIVSSASRATLGSDGSPLGTPSYMAPEQLDVEAQPDVRSDVYGLAASLYHLLTGRPPFDGPVPKVLATIGRREPTPAEELRPGLPGDLVAIVEKGMAADPARRYPSAAAFRDDLVAWLEYRPVTARRASWLGTACRRARRSPQVRGAAAVLLVGLAATTWWLVSGWRDHAREVLHAALLNQVPPALVNALPEHRAAGALRRSAAVANLLDELVDVEPEPGFALAVRAIHRSDGGDLAGAALDVERIAARGNAPFARAASASYRNGRLPDALARAAEPPSTGSAADRVLAVVHAMRSDGPCPAWVEELLRQDGGLERYRGFAELHLLLRARQLDGREPGPETTAAFDDLDRAARRLATLRGGRSAIGCQVLAGALVSRGMAAQAAEVAAAGMVLAPEDFTLPISGGAAAMQLGDWVEAQRLFRRAIELQPRSVHAYMLLGDALMGGGELDAAERLLAATPFDATPRGDALRAGQEGMLLYLRAFAAMEAAEAQDSDAAILAAEQLARRARDAFRRARDHFGRDRSLEELLCDDLLGEETSCAAVFDLLARSPLDPRLLHQVAKILPDSLTDAEVASLARLLFRQADLLGLRRR